MHSDFTKVRRILLMLFNSNTNYYSFLFIYYLPLLVVYFVCDSASDFGAMGSTSFLGFSYPNLLLVFSEPVIFRSLYHIFPASVGTFSASFLFYFYFSVPLG